MASESSSPLRAPAESLTTTLTRTVALALVVGGIVAWRYHDFSKLPVAALLALWFTLGGHYVELFFLHRLRPRMLENRAQLMLARLGFWFVCGIALGAGMVLTTDLSAALRAFTLPSFWMLGLGFVGVELIAHSSLALRRRPNFYNGLG